MAHRLLPLLLTAVVLALVLTTTTANAATLHFAGGLEDKKGEANAVVASLNGNELTIRDRVPIQLQWFEEECRQPDPNTVICPATRTPVFNLGDGDDSFTWAGPVPKTDVDYEETQITVDGGGGTDVLRGSDGRDTISGGPGADRLEAGAGDDHMSSDDDGARDVLDGQAGKDYLIGHGPDVVIGGAGKDNLEAETGGEIVARDGEDDMVMCKAPIARLSADLFTAVPIPKNQDRVLGCFEPGRERGRIRLLTKKRRFVITKRTRVIKLKFACPRSTAMICNTEDMSDLGSRFCECSFEARAFSILPGQRLVVPFRMRRSDLYSLMHTLYWEGKLKGAITWPSELGVGGRALDGVRITMINGGRKKRD